MIVTGVRRARRPRGAVRLLVTAGWLVPAVTWIGCDKDAAPQGAATKSTIAEPTEPSVSRQAIEAAIVAAEDYLTRNDLASARTILAKLVEEAPREHRARELYGTVLYLEGARAAQQGDHPTADALYERAYGHYRAAVEAAVEVEPLAAAGLHQSAGEIASVAGLREPALEHFQAAARLDPAVVKHPLYAAQMLIQLERFAEARLALERVLELDPHEPYAHASLATVALHEEDRESAVEHIREARAIDPGNIGILIQEARIRRQCGDPRRALELLLALDEQLRAEQAVAAEIAECYRALETQPDAPKNGAPGTG